MNEKVKPSSFIFSILPFLLVFSLSPIQGQVVTVPSLRLAEDLSIIKDQSSGVSIDLFQAGPDVTTTPEPFVSETPSPQVTSTTVTASPVNSLTPEPTQTATATPTPTVELSSTPPPTETPTETKPAVVQLFIAKERFSFVESFSLNLAQISNCKIAAELAKIGVTMAEIPAQDLETTLDTLEADENIIYVETVGDVQALEVVPNDPGYIYQPELRQIRAPQAWEVSTGSDQVSIAVIDSGVDPLHPDLSSKILPGCDFVNEDADASDDNGHGTHVAGIAAASGSDGIGIAGVSWGARILPVKVLDASGNGNYATLAAGIIWAADHGVQIINLSLGGVSSNLTLKAAIDYAISRGVLVIAASGNDGSSQLRFPAGYLDVLAVGSVDGNNTLSTFSNFGAGLDVVAPGEEVYSTVPGGYDRKTGTSMSVPYVSGLAAILWGFPNNANANLVQAQIIHSARDLGVYGWDEGYGYGLLRMDRAIQAAQAGEVLPGHKKTRTPTSLVPEDGVYPPPPTVTPMMELTRAEDQLTPAANEGQVIPAKNGDTQKESDRRRIGVDYQEGEWKSPISPVSASDSASWWVVIVLVCGSFLLIQLKYPQEK